MATTFTDMGIPFPLFDAPIDEASEYLGLAKCTLCGASRRHCFELDIGTAIMIPCPRCDVQNALDALDREDVPCRNCGNVLPFPEFPEESLYVCYECLRDGKAAITKDTELGMVSWEQAFAGITHGLPDLIRSDFELVPLSDGRVGARVPQQHLFELLRTPTYDTWQDERWLFCCKEPMVYLGCWERDDFMTYAPDVDGKDLFAEIVEDGSEALWEGELLEETGIYVFRCRKCARLRAHWDIA